MPPKIYVDRNYPELAVPTRHSLIARGGWVAGISESNGVALRATTANAHLAAEAMLEASKHWVFLEVVPAKGKPWATVEAALKTLQTNYPQYQIKTTTVTGEDLGTLYGYKRHYVLCTTDTGAMWQGIPRLEAFKGQARWSEVRAKGVSRGVLARLNSGGGGNDATLSPTHPYYWDELYGWGLGTTHNPDSYLHHLTDHFTTPDVNRLRRWALIAGPMPMIWDDHNPRTHYTNWAWVAWSMGHGSGMDLSNWENGKYLQGPCLRRSNPFMAYWALWVMNRANTASYEALQLF